ncbi:hypothetical protein [Burkholderia glumae]|uniref:hypothetical protein n=1 Tax=Burkholderia glumae TaxID=337 RepID=UPI002150D8C1|nr:hypothetical protein [Burkholderia glumae]
MEASLVEAPPPEHAPEATAERVLARVERAGRDVPAGVARTPTSGGQTVLQVSFENNGMRSIVGVYPTAL